MIEKVQIGTLWGITAGLLVLKVTGMVDWSAWYILAPVLGFYFLTVVVGVIIGTYRGWKTRIVHGKGVHKA
jgi:hypothetical protein